MRTKKPNLTELVTNVCDHSTPITQTSCRPVFFSSMGQPEARDVDGVSVGTALSIGRGTTESKRQSRRKLQRYIESRKASFPKQPGQHSFEASEQGAEQQNSCRLGRLKHLVEKFFSDGHEAEAIRRIVRETRQRAGRLSVADVQALRRKFAQELVASILIRNVGPTTTSRTARFSGKWKRKRLGRANSQR
ncbi:hypothetical protein E5S69_14620 [Cupriavidus necator]|uniref:hypothetical protein n=1 Tax=Cupriavidus necator TaxID=106590 RepID=UPI0014900035|nr:hypothetical protein [Cupriavidus necator]NOV24741.1 hypothetical protein [Cupriavidus necator]